MSNGRKINFGAGPSMISFKVLTEIQNDMLNYKQTGVGILELSHRSEDFRQILQKTKDDVRYLLNIPENYHVLLLPAGGTGQTAAIALNLMQLKPNKCADYFVTGKWSEKAAKEASKFGTVHKVLPKMESYGSIPSSESWNLNEDASYVYYCDNETIDGVEFKDVPDTNGVPIVCDMSSNIMSRPVDISKFGVIYAGAQKNLGCAGVTLVIVRDDLTNVASPLCPSVIEYKAMVNNNSCLNTPPVFSIYVLGAVVKNLKEEGGLAVMYQRCKNKSEALYKIIDESNGFYVCPVDKSVRSRTNIIFKFGSNNRRSEMEKKFLKEAAERNLVGLSGHRSIGGFRASLYNAVTIEDVEKLACFMQDFASKSHFEKED
ncbi:phosphoserine aminotransferase [Octopus bimaculoides]|uniref:Phosphoserine aminotransferase n=1 Tax=Octopus bimaculoides TaxID=37653 RepID=A0A0L8HN48_OCTBM|nr:phosphoserine aminotransferase [Octopus bimaculoides]|eukprot:XP_014770904.1 PREDICTED: phosphoserine aminotransferase-like [Octopus bimaculoides]